MIEGRSIPMRRQVNCECGYVVRDDSEERVVSETLQHVTNDHPELVDHVTPEVVRGWIELVP
jgi:predicted small metal-binding protein